MCRRLFNPTVFNYSPTSGRIADSCMFMDQQLLTQSYGPRIYFAVYTMFILLNIQIWFTQFVLGSIRRVIPYIRVLSPELMECACYLLRLTPYSARVRNLQSWSRRRQRHPVQPDFQDMWFHIQRIVISPPSANNLPSAHLSLSFFPC